MSIKSLQGRLYSSKKTLMISASAPN